MTQDTNSPTQPKGRCLVLMPFASQFKEVYDQIYKLVCENNGFACWRVDELNTPGSITQDIIEGIVDSDLIIADLTTKNANVFYELGIAHSTGNKTIMTAQNTKDIPFDIGNYRVIVYDQSISGAKKLYAQLDSAIKEWVKAMDRTNNPVQDVFSRKYASRLTRKRLLMEAVDLKKIKKAFREIIDAESIVYVQDLKKLDFAKLREKYGIGPGVMSEIAGILLKLDLISDHEAFHKIAIKHKFSPKTFGLPLI